MEYAIKPTGETGWNDSFRQYKKAPVETWAQLNQFPFVTIIFFIFPSTLSLKSDPPRIRLEVLIIRRKMQATSQLRHHLPAPCKKRCPLVQRGGLDIEDGLLPVGGHSSCYFEDEGEGIAFIE